MILKDQAMALRMYPFGNSSRIVVWLSRSHGKLATLAKGSQRGRSPFLGQVDLFYTCEILFYAREQRNLHILKDCSPEELRAGFRFDWRACAAASYATGLLDRTLPFGPAPAGFYRLFEQTLDQWAARTPGPGSLPRFELGFLQELGLAPGWDACAKCRTDLRRGTEARWDAAHGAVLCGDCGAGLERTLSGAALQAIRLIRDGQTPPSLPEPVFREVSVVTGGLLEYHANLSSHARDIAFQVLRGS